MTISDMVDVAGCSYPEGNQTDGAKWLREVQSAGGEGNKVRTGATGTHAGSSPG